METLWVPIVRMNRRNSKKEISMYSWEKVLRKFERGTAEVVPVNAFMQSMLRNMNWGVMIGCRIEVRMHDFDEFSGGTECRWIGIIERHAGFRILIQWLGCESKLWLHMLTDDIHYLGHARDHDKNMVRIMYAGPTTMHPELRRDISHFMRESIAVAVKGQQGLLKRYEKDRQRLHDSMFIVGQRLELLNYNLSTEIRVARIQEICGRRINVLVMKEDFPGKMDEDDRQLGTKGAQYWIDQDSFMIFPVGWAAYNGYKLNAKKDYIEYSKKVARDLKNDIEPMYHPNDVTFDDLERGLRPGSMDGLKIGQKFELLDPLAQTFQKLCAASVLAFLPSSGYIIVGMDGPDAMDDSFPIRIDNVFMFPVGFAEKYKLPLQKPEAYKGSFSWDKYLQEENATPVPLNCFREEPDEGRMEMFTVGAHLEAADMCENQFICPATIKAIHGRLLLVNFDGWDSDFDELYDVDSHDILPVGWCEYHNYELQAPKKCDT